MKFIFMSFRIIFVTLMIWIIGLFWFVKQIPQQVSNNIDQTDAIVVLTGANGRVDAGIKLLKEGKAKKLFISGVGKNLKIDDIKNAENHHDIKLFEDDIVLGHSAFNTEGNADETKEWIEKNQYTSITLVTSNYHIPRSMSEFTSRLQSCKIIPYPVFSSAVRIEKWWYFPGTLRLVITEYNKFLYKKFL